MAYNWTNVITINNIITKNIINEISTASAGIIAAHCPSKNSTVQSSNYGNCSSNLNHTSMNFSRKDVNHSYTIIKPELK
jgi:hypothetical protein